MKEKKKQSKKKKGLSDSELVKKYESANIKDFEKVIRRVAKTPSLSSKKR